MNIIIKRYNLSHIKENNKILYNTNNHGDSPEDYEQVCNNSDTCNWINLFHSHNSYHKLIIKGYDMIWIKEAFRIGCQTGKFPQMYAEELENFYQNNTIPEGNWFVRTDKVSLKYGMHGVGPYSNMKSIIESIVTTTPTHKCFNDTDTEMIIYLIPWKEVNYEKEFRVFVHNNIITGISIQHLYSINNFFNSLTDNEIKDLMQNLVNYFKNNIKDKLLEFNSYVMDLALLDNDNYYFIEINPFGKEYSSGSALFEWLNDYDILYNTDNSRNNTLEFRFTSKN